MTDAQLTPKAVLAQSLRWNRERMHLTAQELSDRVAALGGKIARQAIGSIELGRRDVSVDELMFLARALNMTPLGLLFPVGVQTDKIPASVDMAGKTLDMWDAAKWFSGESYMAEDVNEHWAVPLYLFRQHDRLLGVYAETLADEIFAPRSEDELRRRTERADRTVMDLRNLRAEMRRHGLTPPALEPGLEHVDERRHAFFSAIEAERLAADHPGGVRLVDGSRPGKGKVVRPGDATRMQEQIGEARRLMFEQRVIPP